ncbi:MAG: LCP family protein [Thermoclostridium sp.]|nr:LCP family protein [Thermoclostridium sp.]
MGMQKKTKIALLFLLSSVVVFAIVMAIFVWPEKPVETIQVVEDPIITAVPTPTLIDDVKEPDESVVVVPEEPKGLTNGQKYYKDLVEEGSRNILLIGRDAVYGAYDSIIVLNIDDKNKTMKLINIPRDMYVDYNDKILGQLREADLEKIKDPSIQKLNAAHAIGISLKYKYETGKFGKVSNMNFWSDLLEEVFNIVIDDYIIIQTSGFREIVDFFGGVEIDVPMYMHYEDPFQNLYIHLEPGLQRLNGEQAEGFVRFRQGYTREGVFETYSAHSRQQNTNIFLKAFFEQHVNLSNLGRLDEFMDVVVKNVRTSVNSTSEILQYSNTMQKVLRGKYETSSIIVSCPNNKIINGISYEMLRTQP